MYLGELKLTYFKNYEFQSLEFSPRLNLIAGLNGMGKTNLLDAVYYLCMGKSHFAGTDRNVARHGESFFRLEGHFRKKENKEKIVAKVQPGKTKVLEKNDKAYDRLADHVGMLPIVFKAPDDTALALEGSEERRRFLDNTLSQIDAQYLEELIFYNRVLSKRNAALKKFVEKQVFDPTLLAVFDEQLLEPAAYIFSKRKEFIELFHPIFQEFYQKICGGKEEVELKYRSQLDDEDYDHLLEQAKEKDRILQRTTVGPHKDDLPFYMNEKPLKRFASQGQLKSFVLSMKLAQWKVLKNEKGIPPILLLDDLFDKLDDERVKQLIELLSTGEFGQVFITDTHPERSEEMAKDFGGEYKKFIVSNGEVVNH